MTRQGETSRTDSDGRTRVQMARKPARPARRLGLLIAIAAMVCGQSWAFAQSCPSIEPVTISIKETDLSGNGRDCVKAPDDQTTALATVRACTFLIVKNPSWDARYYERRGYSYFEMGLYKEAIADLSRAADCPQNFRPEGALSPDSRFELLRIRGMAQARFGNSAAAQKDFDDLLNHYASLPIDKSLVSERLGTRESDRYILDEQVPHTLIVAEALALAARADLNLDTANPARNPASAIADLTAAIKRFETIISRASTYCRPQDRNQAASTCPERRLIEAMLSSAHESRAKAYAAIRGANGEVEDELAELFSAAAVNPAARIEVRRRLGAISARRSPAELIVAYRKHAEAGVPASIEFLVFRAQAHLALGDKAASVRDYDSAIKLAGNEADLYFGRAGVHLAKPDRVAALADLNAAIQRDATTSAYWMVRGKVRLESGDAAGAISDYSAVIRLSSGLAEAYLERADAYRAQGAPASAETDIEQALKLEPDSVRARTARAMLNIEKRDWKAALADLDVAVKADSAGPSTALRGTVRAASGDHAGAISDLNATIEQSPRDATLLAARARSYLAVGRTDAALRDAESALQLDPKHQVALATRALVHAVPGRAVPGRAPAVSANSTTSRSDAPEAPNNASQKQTKEAPQNTSTARSDAPSNLVPLPGSRQSFRDLKTNGQPCPECPEMVVLPPNRFKLSYNYTITIRQSFAVSKFEVTFDEWEACVSGGGCTSNRKPNDHGWGRGRRPVIGVSWPDAKEYVAWLSRTTGNRYRLLSGSEWEYAAGGGSPTNYAWGDDIDCGKANYDGGKASACYMELGGKLRGTRPVGSYSANQFGLHDFHGNVWEWIEDCWHDNGHAPRDGSSWVTSCSDRRRLVRGGAWNYPPHNVVSGGQLMFDPELRGFDIGIRVAREITETHARYAVEYDEKKDAELAKQELNALEAEREKQRRSMDWLIEDYNQHRLALRAEEERKRKEAVAKRKPEAAAVQRTFAPGQTFRDCGNGCPEMVVVPAGSFTMGGSGQLFSDNEKPAHRVTIRKPFAVGKFEVTFDEWKACAAGGGCQENPEPEDQDWGRGRRPVINVSWSEAQQYVTWLIAQTGARYRLLTEAEWEYAARAGSTTWYSWGNQIGKGNANCKLCGSKWDDTETAPVGSFAPNRFGLHDMHGNVAEWVEDCYKPNYRGAPTDGSAVGGAGVCSRVSRGGSWMDFPTGVRATSRTDDESGTHYYGFRVARDIIQ